MQPEDVLHPGLCWGSTPIALAVRHPDFSPEDTYRHSRIRRSPSGGEKVSPTGSTGCSRADLWQDLCRQSVFTKRHRWQKRRRQGLRAVTGRRVKAAGCLGTLMRYKSKQFVPPHGPGSVHPTGFCVCVCKEEAKSSLPLSVRSKSRWHGMNCSVRGVVPSFYSEKGVPPPPDDGQ